MKSMFFNKIIWAVDVNESEKDHSQALFILDAMARASGSQVDPVYVLHPPYIISSSAPSECEQAFQALAEKKLYDLSKKSEIPTMSPGKVLVDRSTSTRKAVQRLVDYAEKEGAGAIVVATHARKGVPRFFMGSFAETLALHATVPVITVNPQTKVRESIAKILFPTTFQPRFRRAFERVVELAKSLDAGLTLYYKEPMLLELYASPAVYQQIEQDAVARGEQAKEWQGWATHYGVPTEVIIDDEPGYIVSSIEELAITKNFDLIAMGSEAGPVSASLLGSSARQIIRQAPCPVWIVKVKS